MCFGATDGVKVTTLIMRQAKQGTGPTGYRCTASRVLATSACSWHPGGYACPARSNTEVTSPTASTEFSPALSSKACASRAHIRERSQQTRHISS